MKKKTTFIIPAAIALAIASGSEGVLAQTMDEAAQTGIYEGLYDFYYYTVPLDYVFEEPTSYGTLNSGQNGTMARGMVAGSQYLIAAQCEPDDCQSIYLHVHDPSGALVIEERTGANTADVAFQAAQSGDYTIGVTMVACNPDPCHFGVDVYSKATP